MIADFSNTVISSPPPSTRWIEIFSFNVASTNCFSVDGFDFFNRLMLQTLSPIFFCVLLFPLVWASRQTWKISFKRPVLMKVFPAETTNVREAGVELPSQAGAAEVAERIGSPTADADLPPLGEAIEGVFVENPAGEDAQDDNAADAEVSFYDRYLSLVLYITYLVLPSVTTTIFSAFPRLNVNPSNIQGLPFPSEFLAADFSIAYDSPRYWQGVMWAVVMIFIYPIGIPLMYLLVLYRNRVKIQEYKKLKKGV